MANSALYATVTTDASCGAVNSMHGSFTALGGLVPLVNIMLGEVIFCGVGAISDTLLEAHASSARIISGDGCRPHPGLF